MCLCVYVHSYSLRGSSFGTYMPCTRLWYSSQGGSMTTSELPYVVIDGCC